MNSNRNFHFILTAWFAASCATTDTHHSTQHSNATDRVDSIAIGFDILQSGHSVKKRKTGDIVEYLLKSEEFLIVSMYWQFQLCLRTKDLPEQIEGGYGMPCLHPANAGAAEETSTHLAVGNGIDEINNALNEVHGLKSVGAFHQYRVTELFFAGDNEKEIPVSSFSGTLYGYSFVDKNHDRVATDDEITRIRLSFQP